MLLGQTAVMDLDFGRASLSHIIQTALQPVYETEVIPEVPRQVGSAHTPRVLYCITYPVVHHAGDRGGVLGSRRPGRDWFYSNCKLCNGL